MQLQCYAIDEYFDKNKSVSIQPIEKLLNSY